MLLIKSVFKYFLFHKRRGICLAERTISFSTKVLLYGVKLIPITPTVSGFGSYFLSPTRLFVLELAVVGESLTRKC